jgi:tetratricopeptide (TPR) repeat protein
VKGKTWAAQGNILVGPQVPEAMGKAFEATHGELAEKLFAALKAGDDAGGDSRGKQSASMLIVRKGGGRNYNNDRYLYLNVDDNPEPIPELRRLLNLALAANYQGKLSGDPKEAREAAAKIALYTPSANAQFSLGIMDYNLGDKTAALADFRKAFEMDANLRNRFTAQPAPPAGGNQKGGNNRLRTILEDKDFVSQLLGK